MFELISMKKLPPWEWPENSEQILTGVLNDASADASDRLLAAELAGELPASTDELADVLLSIAQSGDESEDFRARAAIALGPTLEYAYMSDFEDPDEETITEGMYLKIKESFRKLYLDGTVPEEVRRRVLEGSVRSPQEWHRDAVRAAYTSDKKNWRLTAVFCMRFVKGFEAQILEALDSEDPDMLYEAVCAAGNWQLDDAWPRLTALLTSEETDRDILFAAIEAVTDIRPQEAGVLLVDLADSEDEDIAEAATEAMVLAESLPDDFDFDED
ncbi:MAG: HEAT repeat domain-containing protein [Actinobacteria bacterium]|nr:HEAT repeat domain-containing protein [Actinomycetota bacterium]